MGLETAASYASKDLTLRKKTNKSHGGLMKHSIEAAKEHLAQYSRH